MATEEIKETERPPERQRLSTWTWVALGCGTLLVLGVIAVVLFIFLILRVTGGPVEVANVQLDALRKGRIEKAYNYGSIDFKNSVSLARFKEFVKANPSLTENRRASFNMRKIENNTAVISGTLESSEGAVTPIEYRFVKENGEWKILNINLNQPPPGN